MDFASDAGWRDSSSPANDAILLRNSSALHIAAYTFLKVHCNKSALAEMALRRKTRLREFVRLLPSFIYQYLVKATIILLRPSC